MVQVWVNWDRGMTGVPLVRVREMSWASSAARMGLVPARPRRTNNRTKEWLGSRRFRYIMITGSSRLLNPHNELCPVLIVSSMAEGIKEKLRFQGIYKETRKGG